MYNSTNHNKTQCLFPRIWNIGFNLIPTDENKVPRIKWKNFQTERIPKELAEQWLEKWGLDHWAILTGSTPWNDQSGVVCVDADDAQANAVVHEYCSATPLITTTGKGFHYWYRRPATDERISSRNKTRIDGKIYNLDIKADGAYAILPGSIHKSGRIYEPSQMWTRELIDSLPVYDPSWIPHENLEHKTSAEFVPFIPPEITFDDKAEQAKAWLAGQSGCQVSSGSSCGNRCYLLAVKLIHGFDLPTDIAQELLLQWGQRKDQLDDLGGWYPWTEAEISHKITDATRVHYDGKIGDMLGVPDKVIDSIPAFPDEIELDAIPVEIHKPKSWLEEWPSIMNQQEKESWLIKNWIEFGSLAMLSGDPFSGKSHILAEVVAGIAKHGSFGRYELPQTPILLIDAENKRRILVKRISGAMGDGGNGRLEKLFFRVDTTQLRMPIQIGDSADTIRQLIQDVKRRTGEDRVFVIIDTLRSVFAADEMETGDMKQLLYPLQRIAIEENAAILILHHRPKNGAKYSGQTSIAGACDYLWMWDSDKDTGIGKLSLEGIRGDHEKILEFKLLDGRNCWLKDDSAEDTEDEIISIVQSVLEAEKELPFEELVKAVMIESKKPRTAIRELVKGLEGSILARRKGSHGSQLFSLV